MGSSIKRIAFILAIFLASPSWAVYSLVHKNAHATACSSTVASTTAGNLNVVFCESSSSTPPPSVTDDATGGSNTYTEVVGSRGSLNSGVATMNIFYSQTVHSGATSVTCGGGTCFGSAMYEYSGGLASGNPVDVSTGSLQLNCSGTTCTCNTLSNTTNSGDLIFAASAPNATMTGVASPYGNFESDANGSGTADYIPASTLSGHATVWTGTNGDSFACGTVAFFPAAAGAAAASPNKVLRMERYE